MMSAPLIEQKNDVATSPADCLYRAKRLLRGRGCARDYEAAVELLDLAARAGMADALYQLGKCYLKGIGCSKDPAGGVSCLERAAMAGHAAATYRLGDCFENGLGAPRSAELAAYWYRKAVALHHPKAYQSLLRLAGRK
ncbi:MAG: sel1 repeat family protein [Akkermansia sp.]|nr:sel1 repeat family protein [Akkermansia sp.]